MLLLGMLLLGVPWLSVFLLGLLLLGLLLLLRGEPEVDEEGSGAAIVADEVAEEDVGEVGIECAHGCTDRWYSISYQIAVAGWGSYCLFVLRHGEAER